MPTSVGVLSLDECRGSTPIPIHVSQPSQSQSYPNAFHRPEKVQGGSGADIIRMEFNAPNATFQVRIAFHFRSIASFGSVFACLAVRHLSVQHLLAFGQS